MTGLLAVEGHDVLLVSSYEQDWTVQTTAQRAQPGHIERTGTVRLRYGERPETHTCVLIINRCVYLQIMILTFKM